MAGPECEAATPLHPQMLPRTRVFVRSGKSNHASRGQWKIASSPLATFTMTYHSSDGKCPDAWSSERRLGGLTAQQMDSMTAPSSVAPASEHRLGSLAGFKRRSGCSDRGHSAAVEEHGCHGLTTNRRAYASSEHRSTRPLHTPTTRHVRGEPSTGARAYRVAQSIGPGISSYVRSTSTSGPGSPMQRSLAQLIEDHEWDSRSYMLAAARVQSPDEKSYRIEMAIAAWTKALELARCMKDPHTPRLMSLLLGRAVACLQMAGLSFGTPRSRANFELACMDASAVLEIDASLPQAFLIRARTSIALACSDFTKDAAECDLRLRDATRDLKAVKSQGEVSGNTIDVHAAIVWEKAARPIAKHFTSAVGLPFPDTISDVALLMMRLECEPSPAMITNSEIGRERESGATPGFLRAYLESHFRTTSSWLLTERDICSLVRVVISQCVLGAVLTACLVAYELALGDLVPFFV